MAFPKTVVFFLIAEQRLVSNHGMIGFSGFDLFQQGFACDGFIRTVLRSKGTAIGNKGSAVYGENRMFCIQVQRLHEGIPQPL